MCPKLQMLNDSAVQEIERDVAKMVLEMQGIKIEDEVKPMSVLK